MDDRTDMIERQDWGALDNNVLQLSAKVSHLSDTVVSKLRIKTVAARVQAAQQQQVGTVQNQKGVVQNKKRVA